MTWLIPAISAGCGVFLLIVAFAIFFCRKEKSKKKAWHDFNFPLGDTLQFLQQENIVARFIIFQLNFSSLCWSSEFSITKQHRRLVMARRCLNLLVIFLGIFTVDIVDAIWKNWCCYPPSTDIEGYGLGVCWDSGSPIRRDPTTSYPCSLTTMETWEWVFNALFVGSLFTSLGIHAYLSYHFVDDIKSSLHPNYEALLSVLDMHSHRFDPAHHEDMKGLVWMQWNNLKAKANFAPHQVYLHRISHLFIDPFAIFFGFPHILLARSDLAILNFCNIWMFVGTWLLYTLYAVPSWLETCCYYDSATSSGRFGLCNDPASAIYDDPYRQSCTTSTYTWVMQFLLWFGVAQIACIISLWVYITVLFHHLLNLCIKPIVDAIAVHAKNPKIQADIRTHQEKVPVPMEVDLERPTLMDGARRWTQHLNSLING